MTTFVYSFEELPLLTRDDGTIAGLVNGEAEIRFSRDGTWDVGAIKLDAYLNHRPTQPTEIQRTPNTYEAALYMLIWTALTNGAAKVFIQDKVDAAIEDARASFADDLGDHIRKVRYG